MTIQDYTTEFKGHAAILVVKVLTVITLLDALNWMEKLVAIVIAIVMGIWGVRHMKSRIALNNEKKKEVQLRNEMQEQELFERRKRNLK